MIPRRSQAAQRVNNIVKLGYNELYGTINICLI